MSVNVNKLLNAVIYSAVKPGGGSLPNINLLGTKAELRAFREAVVRTNELTEALSRDAVTVAQLVEAAKLKKLAADRFFKLTGFVWPV